MFRDFYNSCDRHVDSGIFTFSMFPMTRDDKNSRKSVYLYHLRSHYPRDEMFFLSCSRHPSRKFTLVQEWNRPYPLCTYRISNVWLRSMDCDNLAIDIIYSTKNNDANHRRDYLSKYIYETYIFLSILSRFIYFRKKELSMEKNYFSRGSIDKDGIHSIGRVYSRNVIYFM